MTAGFTPRPNGHVPSTIQFGSIVAICDGFKLTFIFPGSPATQFGAVGHVWYWIIPLRKLARGTIRVVWLFSRVRWPSYVAKKNSRFFLIGPPTEVPNVLRI